MPRAAAARTFPCGHDMARSALSLLAAVGIAAFTGCVARPPQAGDLIRNLAQEGYTPNAGLSSLYEAGNVIQTTQLDGDGKQTALSPPLVVVWASGCFPHQQPRESPF